MNHFSEEMPFKIYSEAELKQKRDCSKELPDKMAAFLSKGGEIYTAIAGETNDKYVLNHCDTPTQKKSDKKVRVDMVVNAESAEKYERLRGEKK